VCQETWRLGASSAMTTLRPWCGVAMTWSMGDDKTHLGEQKSWAASGEPKWWIFALLTVEGAFVERPTP